MMIIIKDQNIRLDGEYMENITMETDMVIITSIIIIGQQDKLQTIFYYFNNYYLNNCNVICFVCHFVLNYTYIPYCTLLTHSK